jgi:hypothetical protein
VKLSAPPPPPPPSPDEPQPTEPNAAAGTPTSDSPVPEAAPSTAPQLAWPAWFAGADFLLAALAIFLAFLIASFVARNTDIWVHLAAGQRLLAGEYRPGTDPFSYSAADRAWVNHSLLYDVGAFLLFRIDPTGMVLVIAKAIAVSLAFGLLLCLRRPGYSLWPWAAVAVIAILAAAPRLVLSPLVGSLLLLAVTLVLVFRMPHRPNSWRFPIAIGITFWLWAMIDSWFFIGPLALALILIGELAQRSIVGSATTERDDQPLGVMPDPSTLAKALAIGVIACMLNPHHVRIWQLPFELVGADEIRVDSRLRALLMSPLSDEYRASNQAGRMAGYNLNGLAHAVLFLGGGLVLALGAGRLRFAHLALWVGFALLSLTSIYAIPFFAVVSVPIIASELNAVSARVRLKSWGDPRTRFVLVGSASGRVISVFAAAVVCVLAWPGWVHPSSGDPAFARRVAWGVYRDGGMVRAAEQLEAWRKDGSLPAGTRGLITTTELANYCAWFAPSEKVFINARYHHHRAEIAEYLAFRKAFGLIKADDAPDLKQLDEKLSKLGVEYVAVSAGPGDGTRFWTQNAAYVMWRDPQRWSPWYLNGRSMIAGWRRSSATATPTFAGLRLAPIALAFGPRTERLNPGTVKPIPPAMGWEQEFIRGVNLSPAGADEAIGWTDYGIVRAQQAEQKRSTIQFALYLVDHTAGGSGVIGCVGPTVSLAMTADNLEVEELAAIPFLALRAARRAIAADPDHPDGYFALSIALANRGLEMSDEERALARITALRQFLVRLPSPERYRRTAYVSTASGAAEELFQLYLGRDPTGGTRITGTGLSLKLPALSVLQDFAVYFVQSGKGVQPVQVSRLTQNSRVVAGPFLFPLDTIRDTLLIAEKYLPIDFENEEDRKPRSERLQNTIKSFEAQYREANNVYEREREKARNRGVPMKLKDQVDAALQNNLAEEALRLLTDRDTDLSKEFGRETLRYALIRVALRLVSGRLEEAADDLEFLPGKFDEAEATAPKDFLPQIRQLRDPLGMQIYFKLVFEGNYSEAGVLLEQREGQIVKSASELLSPKKIVDRLLPRAMAPSATPWGTAFRLKELYRFQRDVVRGLQAQQSEFFYRRGLLSLIEGDIAGARKRFEQTTIPAIKDWDVPELRRADAQRLLRLIQRAEKSGQ